jgi:hypothetical protein
VSKDDIGGLVFVGFAEENALIGDDGNDAGGGSARWRRLKNPAAGSSSVGYAAAGSWQGAGGRENGGERFGSVGDEGHD